LGVPNLRVVEFANRVDLLRGSVDDETVKLNVVVA